MSAWDYPERPAEVETLTVALLADLSSRLHAASLRWPMSLPEWTSHHLYIATMTRSGVEPSWPWDHIPLTTEETAAAAAELGRRSALRHHEGG